MSQVEDWNWDENRLSQRTRENICDSDFPDTDSSNNENKSNTQDKYTEDISEKDDDSSEPDIVYTAPTGKAANLLGRKAKTTGYTLHQIIWSYRLYVTKLMKLNTDAEWKFKSVKILVVDECSMVAVSTFSTLLTTLMENSKLRRIVLLGDVRQLPSIESGNFLSDVYRSMYPVKSSIELMTNHRAESHLIIENATTISQNRYPLFSSDHNFFLHEVPQSNDKAIDMHDSGMLDIQSNLSIVVTWGSLTK
jgi:DNA helicase B